MKKFSFGYCIIYSPNFHYESISYGLCNSLTTLIFMWLTEFVNIRQLQFFLRKDWLIDKLYDKPSYRGSFMKLENGCVPEYRHVKMPLIWDQLIFDMEMTFKHECMINEWIIKFMNQLIDTNHLSLSYFLLQL